MQEIILRILTNLPFILAMGLMMLSCKAWMYGDPDRKSLTLLTIGMFGVSLGICFIYAAVVGMTFHEISLAAGQF